MFSLKEEHGLGLPANKPCMLVTSPTHHVVISPYTSKAAVLLSHQAATAAWRATLLKESPTHSLGQIALTTVRARNRAIREKRGSRKCLIINAIFGCGCGCGCGWVVEGCKCVNSLIFKYNRDNAFVAPSVQLQPLKSSPERQSLKKSFLLILRIRNFILRLSLPMDLRAFQWT